MKNNKKAFTLIELLIVIAMLLLLLSFVFMPYAHYQEKIKARQVIREASQSILEARSMARNGFDEVYKINGVEKTENRSIGVYFSNSPTDHDKTFFYTFPYNIDEVSRIPKINPTKGIKLLRDKERPLPTKTRFRGAKRLKGDETPVTGRVLNNVFFFFDAISGDASFYTFDPGLSGNRIELTDDKIELEFSYGNSDSSVLKKKLIYDTRVNIIDF